MTFERRSRNDLFAVRCSCALYSTARPLKSPATCPLGVWVCCWGLLKPCVAVYESLARPCVATIVLATFESLARPTRWCALMPPRPHTSSTQTHSELVRHLEASGVRGLGDDREYGIWKVRDRTYNLMHRNSFKLKTRTKIPPPAPTRKPDAHSEPVDGLLGLQVFGWEGVGGR